MVVLKSKKITLRPYKMSDTEDLHRNLNDYEIVRHLLTVSWPYRRKNAIEFLKKVVYGSRKKNAMPLAIVYNETKEVIGGISLVNINLKNKRAETGTWIARKYWRQGVNTEAKKMLISYGFNKLKLHKIVLEVFSNNLKSQKAIEKLGAKKEGVLRDQYYRFGKYRGVVVYSILKKEWKPSKIKMTK